jgi:hypothetical protein
MTTHRSPIRTVTAACGRIGLAALVRSAAGLALPLALAAVSAPARAEVYVVRPPVVIRSGPPVIVAPAPVYRVYRPYRVYSAYRPYGVVRYAGPRCGAVAVRGPYRGGVVVRC